MDVVKNAVALVGGIVAGIVMIFYLDANLPPVSPTTICPEEWHAAAQETQTND